MTDDRMALAELLEKGSDSDRTAPWGDRTPSEVLLQTEVVEPAAKVYALRQSTDRDFEGPQTDPNRAISQE